MLPNAFIRNYDQRRLRNLLAVLFLALAIPTGVLTWQAFSQLKWESFYQYRVQAEALTNQIDATINTEIREAEASGFADFAFLNSAQGAKVQQRSPLSTWPVSENLPGLIGYFQVDADGQFSTPLLPAPGTAPVDVGIDEAELIQRQLVASEIQSILMRNELVRDRVSAGARLEAEPEVLPAAVVNPMPSAPEAAPLEAGKESNDSPVPADGLFDGETDRVATVADVAEEAAFEDSDPAYSQQAFDQLNQPARSSLGTAEQALDEFADSPAAKSRANNNYGRVQDLRLDDELQKKSEDLNRQLAETEEETKDQNEADSLRERRFAQSRATESLITIDEAMPGIAEVRRQDLDAGGMAITTFESEVDPFVFSLLDSGHLVLFRNVWRDGNRSIQGLLVDQDRFISGVINAAFRSTTLSDMSNLVVGYNDDVITLITGGQYRSRSVSSAAELDGALLYRSRLTAPFDGLELIFTANRLPPGPGAVILGWTTLVIAIVFLGGFFALYRLGLTQIRLAQQQQDFVSAVSHELKTPLTSIRMYGEMLREGWADEAKQKQYYEYIHDESERLTRLISNVLQLAKISRNEPQFNSKPITVNTLMDQVRSKIANQVERAGFEFRLVQDENANNASVRIDDDCFAQIVINLVDNAIKFSKDAENKTIEVGCRLTNDNRMEFTVRDHGPGIKPDQMKKIFKMFYRTESELTRETVGTGIGLAIVHQLTTAMGGKVDVANCDPGAQFKVSFPSH